jgi:hypothetical protein
MLSNICGFLGLTGSDGRLSFSKMVTLTVLALSVITGTFGLGIAVAALAASFGAKTFLAFLSRHSSTATATTTADAAKVIEAIKARRDPKTGIEPA